MTGASSNHFLPLQSLLWTIAEFEPTARVIAYDLGLTPDEHAYLAHTPPFYLANWELRTFDFKNYPAHFSMEKEAGRMAFRPTVLAAVAHESETRNTEHATRNLVGRAQTPSAGPRAVPNLPRSADMPSAYQLETPDPKLETILLWLDAGCQLREPLDELRAAVARDGVYCPCAPGTIENCLHPSARVPLGITEDLLPLPIRDAGICGFDLTAPVAAVCDRRKNCSAEESATRQTKILALLDRWAEVALDKNCTAPANSTRRTHRQDAVFAVLLNQAAKLNGWHLESKRHRGLAIKQDTLTLAENKFRTCLGPPATRQQNPGYLS